MLNAMASGDLQSGGNPAAQGQLVLSTLADNIDLLKVPNVIIGFRVKDPRAAADEIAKLEGMAQQLGFAVPELIKVIKRQKAGDGDYLTLTVSGAMIPWDDIPLDAPRPLEAHPGDLDKVVAKIKKTTFMLALGLARTTCSWPSGPRRTAWPDWARGRG